MVYLGGMGSLSGSVLSAIVFTLLIEALRFAIPALNSLAHQLHMVPASYEIGQVWKWVMLPLIPRARTLISPLRRSLEQSPNPLSRGAT